MLERICITSNGDKAPLAVNVDAPGLAGENRRSGIRSLGFLRRERRPSSKCGLGGTCSAARFALGIGKLGLLRQKPLQVCHESLLSRIMQMRRMRAHVLEKRLRFDGHHIRAEPASTHAQVNAASANVCRA